MMERKDPESLLRSFYGTRIARAALSPSETSGSIYEGGDITAAITRMKGTAHRQIEGRMERERPLATILVAAAALSLMSCIAWYQGAAGPALPQARGLAQLIDWNATSEPLNAAWELMRSSFNASRMKGESL
jgi:hypothetical protein